jgi:hypothetical protein
VLKNGSDSLLRVRQRNQLVSNGLSFVRGSTTIWGRSAAATHGKSPNLKGQTAFLGNNRGVNWRIACVDSSRRGLSADYSLSIGPTNARNYAILYNSFGADGNANGRFGKS